MSLSIYGSWNWLYLHAVVHFEKTHFLSVSDFYYSDAGGCVSMCMCVKEREHFLQQNIIVNAEKVEFNFLVKALDNPTFQKVEDHHRRLLLDGNREGNTRSCATFRRLEAVEELELLVLVHVENISPSSLGAMWKAYKEDLKSNASQLYTNTISKSNAGTVALAPKLWQVFFIRFSIKYRLKAWLDTYVYQTISS